MKTQRINPGYAVLLLAGFCLTGCATRTVVVPQNHHAQATTHVVYTVKPAKKVCWRHRGHWDCR